MDKKLKDHLNIREIRLLLDGLDRPIAFRRILVDLTGSVPAALLLSQAIYWQERALQPDGWWYKTFEEWHEETGISRRSLERARKKCARYLHSRVGGVPARLYWKVDRDVLKTDLLDLGRGVGIYAAPPKEPGDDIHSSLPKNVSQEYTNVQTGITDSSKLDSRVNPNFNTETTTENILPKITAQINREGEEEADVETNRNKICYENVTNRNRKCNENVTNRYIKTAEEEKEEESRRRLLNDFLRIIPEEEPEMVEKFVNIAIQEFGLKEVISALIESAVQDKRSLEGVWEILMRWEKEGKITRLKQISTNEHETS